MEDTQIVRIVKEAYDRIAQNYQEVYAEIDEQDWKHWDKFIEACIGEKVLDMGCGTGDATKYLLDKGLFLYGIDFSEEMLNIARRQSDKIVWAKGDICNCPYDDKSFKGIVISYTLNHLDDRMMNEMKKEVDRLLKDDGLLLLMYHVGDGDEICKDPLDDNILIYYHYYQKEYLLSLFSNYKEIDYYQRQSLDEAELLNDKAVIIFQKRQNEKA